MCVYIYIYIYTCILVQLVILCICLMCVYVSDLNRHRSITIVKYCVICCYDAADLLHPVREEHVHELPDHGVQAWNEGYFKLVVCV